MSNRNFSLLVMGIALLIIGTGYLYQNNRPQKEAQIVTVTHCQLHESACETTLPNGAIVHFNINPRGIPQLQPLVLRLTLTGMNAKRATVDFKGVDMNMGLMPYPLRKVDGQHFHGKAMLSICIIRKMDWLAQVQIETDDVLWQVNFPFQTVKN